MKSIDVAGKCGDETCCMAKAPYSECRCFVSERIHEIKRLRAITPDGTDASVLAAWGERRRILSILVEECDGEIGSPVNKYMDRVGERAGQITCTDHIRETPITREEWQTVAALEGWE